MGNNDKRPKIRFKGFNDDWEQRKLIEYLAVSKVKNKDEAYNKDDVLSVSGDYGIVNQIEFQGRSFAGASVTNYGVVATGDVVYTKSPLKSNPYGIIKTNKGKTGIVSTLYAVYKPLENTYPEFVQIYFEQDARMNNYMHPLVNKGAKNDMKVSDENALKGDVIFPQKEEQIKISEYFLRLDNLISLHQRKLEKLGNIKKSMLEKMFPKDENKVPEIRFKGFNDDWEQHKVSKEVYSVDTGKSKYNILEIGKYEILGSTGIIGYDDSYDYEGDFLLTARVGANAGTLYRHSGKVKITDNTVFLQGNHIDFVFYLLDKFDLKKLSFGSGQPLIKASELKAIELYIPKNSEEKNKITKYFISIDKLISLHQRKLEKLGNIKKSMLEKMFPKDENKVPEIRFKGFNDDWEQHKVSEITNFHKQGFYTTESYNDEKKYYLLRGTDLTENKLILKDTPKINATEKDYQAFKAQIGDFLIVRSGTVGTYGIVYEDIPAIFGSYLIDFRFNKNQVINEFFGYFYQSDLFKNQLKMIIQQSANTNINAENIKSTFIKLPSLAEQKKISDYFQNIDHLISLHQRKLEKLKNIKKACLEKMFV